MRNSGVLVVLSMEPFVLASAVRATLMVNPLLHVLITGVDDHEAAISSSRDHPRPTVYVHTRNFPARFELTHEGYRTAVAYETLAPVMRYLAAYAGEPDVWPVRGLFAPVALDLRQNH